MSGKRKWWPILGAAVAVLLMASLAAPVFASESRTGAQVTVGPNEVLPDDLYASGDIITIDGTIKGDLIAFGSEIRINGTVEGQVLGAARTIWVNGKVNDDLRVAAYQVQIGDKGAVAHDVNVAAFSFEALNGSSIGGDVYAVSYQSELNGKVAGTYRGATNGLYINGQVDHDVLAEVAAPDPQFNQLQPFMRMSPVLVLGPGLHVADTAVISGALKYVSRGEAIIAPGAKVSQVVREAPPQVPPQERERPPERGFGWRVLFWAIAQIRRLVTLIVVGLLLIWLLPRVIPEAAARLRARPWPSLGWGCVGEVAFFVTLPIIFAVIIGLGLLLGIVTLGGLQTVFIGAGLILEGLWGLLFAVVTSYVAKIVIAFLIGTLLLEQARSKSIDSAFWPMLIGIVLYIIIAAIPILGWLAALAATLFGLGALWLWLRDQWWPPAPVMATVPAGGPAGPAGDFSVTVPPPVSGPPAATEAGTVAHVAVPPAEPLVSEAPTVETVPSADESLPAVETIDWPASPPAESPIGEEPLTPPAEPPSEEAAPATQEPAAAPEDFAPPAPEGEVIMPGEEPETEEGHEDQPEPADEDQSQPRRRRRPQPKREDE